MAKNDKTTEAPKTTEEPKNEATTNAPAKASKPDGQELASTIALKQKHGQLRARPWRMKGGTTEIPLRFDKAEVAQYEAKKGATPAETMDNMLAFAGGDEQAVLDAFNQAHLLAAQKQAKLAMEDEATTLADAQDIVNAYLSGSKRRGTGATGGAKVRAERAEKKAEVATQTASEMIAELERTNPELAAKWKERLAALNG